MKVKIKKAKTRKDLLGIHNVIRETWAATYAIPKKGLSKKMIYEFFKQRWTKEYFDFRYKSLKDINRHNWVVTDYANPDEIIGWFGCEKVDDKYGSFAIYVLPEYQGYGIGKKLMKKGIKWLFETQEYVEIGVIDYNQRGIDFYTKFGFVFTGKKKDLVLGDFVGKEWQLLMRKYKV